MIEIDGSAGEGGGQVLRSALALSAVTRAPFRIRGIRANRSKPGLLRQHVTGVRAAAEICGATVSGDTLRSSELTFEPGDVRPGSYHFAVGTAGSANLVLQTILPPLMLADDVSEVVVEGGTHNPSSPPFHFLRDTFAPLLGRMGVELALELERWGFYPAGGGRIRAGIVPSAQLDPLVLEARGNVRRTEVTAVLANLRSQIGHRELDAVGQALELTRRQLHLDEVDSDGPGNVVMAQCETDAVTIVFSAFGRRGTPAQRVGQELAEEVSQWLARDVPVDEHLADQLLLPIALAGEGRFVTGTPSQHTLTNIEVIDRFLDRRFEVTALGSGRHAIQLAT